MAKRTSEDFDARRRDGRRRTVLGTGARGAILVMLLGLAACDSVEERVQDHHMSGVELVAAGEDAKASLEFRNALRLDPEHAPSRREFAALQERAGDISDAVGNYRAAAENDPQDLQSRLKLAQLLLVGGRSDQALDYAEAALRLAPQDPDALAARATVSLGLGDLEEAETWARKAVEIEPLHVDANIVLVSTRFRSGAREEARTRIEELLELAPEERAFNLLKLSLLEQEEDAEAVGAQLERMAELYPDDVDLRRALARWRLGEGDVEGAEAELRRLADDAETSEPALELVRFLAAVEGADAARAELEARAASAADAASAFPFRLALAELDWRTDRREEAKAALRDLIDTAGGEENASTARTQLASFLLVEGEEEAAARLVDEILAEDAQNADALALRAQIAIDDYRPADAIADLRRARDADPQNPRLMLLEARAHERAGDLGLAGERLAAASRASNFAPDIAGAYVNFLRGRNERSAAESVLAEVVRRNPQNREALLGLAQIRLELEDFAGADQAAAALRATDGGASAAEQVSAASLAAQGRLDESRTVLERLASDEVTEELALTGLVSNYVQSGETERAVAFVEKAIKENPRNARALLLRAELHRLENEPELAEARIREVIDRQPRNVTGYAALAHLQLQQGRHEDAERILQEGLEQVGASEPLNFLLAQILEARGAFDEAIEQYKALFERNPESVVYANNLSSLLSEHRTDDPESMRLAGRVVQRLRGYDAPELQDTYGWVKFLEGDYAEALKVLVPAAEKLPENPLVLYHLGRTYAAVEEADLAREKLEAALSIDPNFSRAESARALIAELEKPVPSE